jgi:hypothetical protein
MPRDYFGFWRVPMYEYYWGCTAAQIQLMMADCPLTLYKRHDPNEGKKPGDPGWVSDPKKLDAAVEKWKKRKKAREERGFDLNKLLNTGEKVPVEKEQ